MGELGQRLAGGRAQFAGVRGEKNAVVKGHFDGLQVVGISDDLHFGVFDGFQLFFLFVHLFADKRSGSGSHSDSDGGTDGGTFSFSGQGSNAGAQRGSAARSDGGTFTCVTHRRASGKHDART